MKTSTQQIMDVVKHNNRTYGMGWDKDPIIVLNFKESCALIKKQCSKKK